MPEIFTKIKNKSKDFWSNLEKSQKTRIVIISSIIVLAITIFIVIAAKPNYVALVHSSDAKEIGEMTKILDSAKISYDLKDNNTGIYVNEGDNSKAQIALVQSGYPKDGISFEDAFKMIGVTTTDDDRKKLWDNWGKNNLKNKLKEGFSDFLRDVDVELTNPEPNYFLDKDNKATKPTASVWVTPKKELSSDQVQSIVGVVAHSVVGLDPKDVFITDNQGKPYNTETDSISSNTNSQQELTKQKKAELQQDVYDYFARQPLDGFDTIGVVAYADLDFDTDKTLTQGIKKPDGLDGGALITNKTTKETMDGGTTGGAAGTPNNPGNGNTPSYPTGTNSSGNYSKSTNDQTYDWSRYTNEHNKAQGKLTEKSSLAISLLYGRRVKDASALTDDFINTIKAGVSSATGVPAANITVTRLKLAPEEVVTESFTDKLSKFINSYGFFVLMLLLIIGLIVAAVPRKKKSEAMEEELTAGQLAAASGPKFIVPENMGDPVPEIEIEERSEVKKQIEKFVKQKPDAVAQLLRNWLSDDWE